MAIPDFQTVMLPLLEGLRDLRDRSMRELTESLAERFALTDEERAQRSPLRPAGPVFSNRVAWSKSHLKAAGILESPQRGIVRITDLGLKALAQKPTVINVRFLNQYPSYT